MLLGAPLSTVISPSTAATVDNVNHFPSFSFVSFLSQRRRIRTDNGLSVMSVSNNESNNPSPVTGVVFEPFEEVQKELKLLSNVSQQSLARHKYTDSCEAAVNTQINVEYSVSYVYHAIYAYFDRDNIALKGFAKFFKKCSSEERNHAELLMEYQNKRGGRVKLASLATPQSEFAEPENGDALNAMVWALTLSKLLNEKLLNLHILAVKNNDAQLAEFIESTFLTKQVDDIKKISEFVAVLRRIGEGHGVWHFDQMLLNA